MENLRIARFSNSSVDLSSLPHQQQLRIAAFDPNRNQLLFATTSSLILCFSLSSHEVSWTLPLNLPNSDDTSSKGRIVGLEFMIDYDVMAVGTTDGELLAVFLSTQSVETVGKVEGGILKMSSSPDGELLAVATGSGLLLLMTLDWEVLHEIPLEGRHREQGRSSENVDEFDTQMDVPVEISWRADSKYFGTLVGSKHLNGMMKICVWERDTGILHACSKALPFAGTALDWIPSGARLASACRHSLTETTRILFFEKNGLERGFLTIDGPSDAIIGQIRWNCSSELLAVLLRCNDWDAIQVWSFRNYHWYLKQEWRYPKDRSVNFVWDPEKTMRLVTWTVSGLVQAISFCWDTAVIDESIGLVVDGACLLVTPFMLSLIPPPMSLFKLRFQSPIQAVALHKLGEEYLIAATLSDGAISFMALPKVENWDALEQKEAVVSNATPLEHRKTFCCMRLLKWLDSGNLLGVMNSEYIPSHIHSNSSSLSIHVQPNVYTSNHERLESLVEVGVQETRGGLIDKDGFPLSNWSAKYNNQAFLDEGVLAIVDNPSGNGLLVHFEDGSTFSYALGRGLNRREMADPNQSVLYPSIWVRALSANSRESTVLVALDGNGRLQVGSCILCTDCTSFTIHVAPIFERRVIHIVYTTKQDLLHVISLDKVLERREFAGIVQDTCDLSIRTNQNSELENIHVTRKVKQQDLLKPSPLWERGAKLITALGGCGVGIVLQTVRGNLETIYPRSLVLGSIATALCKCNFNDAMLVARKHRINLNILVDFRGWETFVMLVPEFIRQVKNLNHVTELIFALNAESVMDSIYRDILLPYTQETLCLGPELATFGSKSSEFQSECLVQGNKVQCVLHAIRKALEEEVVESPKRELCILTTMARSDPPELEDGLGRIKKLREEEMQLMMEGVDASFLYQSSNRLTAEEALKHLLWLSDSESVFNAALGIYDLHLAAMVASNSQGDPLEFLPLLQELEKMPTSVMRYTIDCKLQRFESALKNLAVAGNAHFSQCLQLLIDHPKLFGLGKHIFKEGPERRAVLEAWGDHLLQKERFEDAAAAFCCCFELEKAMGAYRAGGHWQDALVVAGMLGWSHQKVISLAQELQEELQALGRPGDAAKIALEYCNNVEDAVCLFTQAREWTEALRVAYSNNKAELVKEIIKPAALECASSYLSEFEEGFEKIGQYLARYLALKQRRLLLEMKLKRDSAEDIEDDSTSDISSNVSAMSAYTSSTRASKVPVPPSSASTRESKQSRRKTRSGRIRAGSPGEEAALIEYLKSKELTAGVLEDIRRLLGVLVLVGHNSMAEKLQRLVFQFQCSQHKAVAEAEGNVGKDPVSGLQWWMEVLDAEHLTSMM